MLKENSGRANILIVDDESVVRNVLSQLLSENYRCVEASSAEAALEILQTEKFELVLSDIKMRGISGLEMAPRIGELAPDTILVMISGEQNIESAVNAMRVGALDYISKPFCFDNVEAVVKRALEHQARRLTRKHRENHLEELVTARTAELREQITERRQAEEKVNQMAYYDPLTELPNPALFRSRLKQALHLSAGNPTKSAIVFLAIDRFKNINDTLGHKIGEDLLRGVAQRLKNGNFKINTTAYFGGAEFALLLTKVSCAEEAAKIVQNIKNALIPPFKFNEQEIFLTASIGISLSPNDGSECQALLQNAGTALYCARQGGGDACRFYTAEMHEKALKRISLENDLWRALERDEFVLYYQPKVNVKSGKFAGMEALLRWRHPKLGLVPPNDFIPITEDNGLIVPLGEWALRTACRQNAAWRRAGLPAQRVSVNLSLRQFQQAELVEVINQILVETNLPPEYLELELTESVIMNDTKEAIEILNQLKRLGIKISLDDFGSGHSSLAYLKTLPIDVLKVDRTFVQNITSDSKDLSILKTIVALARNLNLKTVIEGVETKEQLAVLSGLGCHELQGYYFSKPVPADSFELLLKKQETDVFALHALSLMPEFM